MRERVESPGSIRGRVSALVNSFKRRRTGTNGATQAPTTLKVARYKLILMDDDGQVVWTGEWDAGGAFDFGPRHRLWIFCEFTNHSQQEARIAEYEIELVSDEELVVGRFGSAFGDSVVVVPGQSKVLSGSWQL
jgi:hypothetical protein